MDTEYSPSEVDEIISSALESLRTKNVIPFSFSDSNLLHKLLEILPTYVGTQADAQYILSQLRAEILSCVSTPDLPSLHAVTRHCTRCPDKVASAAIPQWNMSNPTIVIVAANPVALKFKDNTQFLVESLKAAGFSSADTCLTYATRCTFAQSQLPTTCFTNCASYLHNELQVLSPKLTITLGAESLAVLLGPTRRQMKEVEGQIIWLGIHPIMPLYSLAYVLRQGEYNQSILGDFQSNFRKAYIFCYGEN